MIKTLRPADLKAEKDDSDAKIAFSSDAFQLKKRAQVAFEPMHFYNDKATIQEMQLKCLMEIKDLLVAWKEKD